MLYIKAIKKYCCEETKRKISEANKGKLAWNKGKHHSEETKRKMSEALKGKNVGKHWFNNGEISVYRIECPDGFVSGRLYYKRGEI